MKLFTVGPVMMFQETLKESKEQLPYFRTAEFSEIMLDSERILKELLNAGPGSKVAFLTASGTGAMEATVSSAFTEKDRLLIIVGGGFGKRFTEICDVHGIPYDTVDLAFRETLTAEKLNSYKGRGYTGLLVNLDETSTGQLYDLGMIASFCRSEKMHLVVDAISAFLADPINVSESGIDALILSSQKALALAPGISVVVMSGRLYDERITVNPPVTYYLNLKHHVTDQMRGQTPFTPAVGILLNLNTRLRSIESKGITAEISRVRELAEYFRKKAREMGLCIPDYPLSNAVTPLYFENGGAKQVYERLRNEYDITVTPSGGALADKVLRVGHIGNLTKEDYDILLATLKEVLE